jgi:hypothetical protein
MERADLAMETLGLTLAEGKTMLHGVQDFVATQQALEDLNRRRVCPACSQRYHSKDAGAHSLRTVFGSVEVRAPPGKRDTRSVRCIFRAMPISVPICWRSQFQTHADHHSKVMAIIVPN